MELPLPITDHPQEERINSLKNQGISSSQKIDGKFSENAACTAANATATTSQPVADASAAAAIATTNPNKIYIPDGVYNEDKAGDGYDKDDQIGPLLGDMEIEGTQIFEEEEAMPPVAVPVQMNTKSATIMVVEVTASDDVSGPATLAKQYLA